MKGIYVASLLLYVSFLMLSWSCVAAASTKHDGVKKAANIAKSTVASYGPLSTTLSSTTKSNAPTVSAAVRCTEGKQCPTTKSSKTTRGSRVRSTPAVTGKIDIQPTTPSWNGSGSVNKTEEALDACGRWEQCRIHKHPRVVAWLQALPGCPCIHRGYLYIDDRIYDPVHNKTFRWHRVNPTFEKLHIYKPYAKLCIRQVFTNRSTAVQQCCYDNYHRLITRGSGAGTPQLVSRDIDFFAHDKVDLLPWRLCGGDWTRYHNVRPPNNALNCIQNPGDDQYNLQRRKATEY